jgi:hypothetical protein
MSHGFAGAFGWEDAADAVGFGGRQEWFVGGAAGGYFAGWKISGGR